MGDGGLQRRHSARHRVATALHERGVLLDAILPTAHGSATRRSATTGTFTEPAHDTIWLALARAVAALAVFSRALVAASAHATAAAIYTAATTSDATASTFTAASAAPAVSARSDAA